MPAPLIADAWRRPLAVTAGVAIAGLAALAGAVAQQRSTAFDDWAYRESYWHIGSSTARTLLDLSKPAIAIAVLAVVVVASAVRRQWRVTALAVFGPMGTVLLTEVVLKPLTGRDLVLTSLQITFHGTFPSGHEATACSTACVLLIAAGRIRMRRRTRALVAVILAAWTLVVALALVRNLYHYATDTIGAICLSVAVVSLVAFGIDRLAVAATADEAAPEPQLTWRS